MRRAVVVAVALGCAFLAAGVDTAGATSECRGFITCVPVAGPWVVLPVSRSEVQYQLTCPKGFVVGGVDAELSDRAIDVWFLGAPGSPVAPGRTTSRTLVFVARYVGAGARAPTFRPHAGCIPGGGGGRRTPTSVKTVFPPGKPTVRRVKNARISGPSLVSVACRSGERLVAAYGAAGFRTATPPSPQLVASMSTHATVGVRRISVAAQGGGNLGVVQVEAVCAGGR